MPAYLQVSREWALQVQPDVLMISDPQQQGLAALRARPGWQRYCWGPWMCSMKVG